MSSAHRRDHTLTKRAHLRLLSKKSQNKAKKKASIQKNASAHIIDKLNTMNSKDFFYTVAQLRAAQKQYFKTRDPLALRAARKLENVVDAEIERVRSITCSM